MRSGGAVFNALLSQIERRLAEVIKEHAITLRRNHHRHGDAHQLGAFLAHLVAVVLAVVVDERVAGKVKRVAALASAVERFLALVQQAQCR